jgi:hypothetical protein
MKISKVRLAEIIQQEVKRISESLETSDSPPYVREAASHIVAATKVLMRAKTEAGQTGQNDEAEYIQDLLMSLQEIHAKMVGI